MTVCFVHAPNVNGWNGELLLVKERDSGHFKVSHLERICNALFPNDDFSTFHFDANVAEPRVTEYRLRREKGFLQRISAHGTYEDLHLDEWIKGVKKHYPELGQFAAFLMNG